MIYFKFNHVLSMSDYSKKQVWVRLLENIVIFLCNLLLPHSNPDFEDKYVSVCSWYLEFDNVSNETMREIGLDSKGNIIVLAPYKRNRGFWVDEEYSMTDYKKFDIQMITEQEFNAMWKSACYDGKIRDSQFCQGT